jgi:hypothetical protein
MKKIFTLSLILIPYLSMAQNCNCSDNFKFIVERIKNNYVGYGDKVTSANQKYFDHYTDSLQKIADVTDRSQCKDVWKEWLSFFKDGHISISSFAAGKATKGEIGNYFAGAERTVWNENDFNQYLVKNKNTLDVIEGFWVEPSNVYKIGIVKEKNNEFIGFVISADSVYWNAQQVKFRIKKEGTDYRLVYYRAIDHSKYFPPIIVSKDLIDFGDFGKWQRGDVYKGKVGPKTARQPDYTPYLKVLDQETNLLVIPYFAARYKVKVDSILDQNVALLKKSKHLIIDIRNNSGGVIGTFEKLLPYIYTNPIHIEGASVLATVDNIKDGYDIDFPDLPQETTRKLKEDVKKLKAHVGELYPLYPGYTLKLKGVMEYPERVSVLMNGGSASAAELFILRAEQSKKVTLFGRNSAGAIDYTEIVKAKMPCNYFNVIYPACKSDLMKKRPLNNVGIAPNVIIPDNVPDWVEFVKNYKLAP